MAKSNKSKSSEIELISALIQPIIRNNGELHPLEKTFNEDPDLLPKMTAVGIAKIDPNRNHSWVSYTITTQGDKVLKIEVSEPDMKAIAEESAKIAFVDQFTDQEM